MSINLNRKRVICLITSLPIGGAEKSLLRLIKNSMDEVDYLVVSLDSKRDIEEKFYEFGVDVHNLNISNLLSFIKAIFVFRNIVNTWKPSIIYSWMYHAIFFDIISSIFFYKIPHIWGIRHNNLDTNLNKFSTVFIAKFIRFFSLLPKKIVYCSLESLNFHISIGYSSKNSILIENGFDPDEFTPKDSLSSEAIVALKIKHFPVINTENIFIGCCGRYDPLKRFENFISVAIEILEKRSDVNFCLIGEELPTRKDELLLNVPLQKRQNFYFIGATQEINEVYPCLDILVQTSFSESFPNVIPEAMLSGVAIVATNVGQTSVILGDSGILVEPDDIQQTVKSVFILLDDHKYLNTLSKHGTNRIVKNFGIEDLVTKNLNMYEELI